MVPSTSRVFDGRFTRASLVSYASSSLVNALLAAGSSLNTSLSRFSASWLGSVCGLLVCRLVDGAPRVFVAGHSRLVTRYSSLTGWLVVVCLVVSSVSRICCSSLARCLVGRSIDRPINRLPLALSLSPPPLRSLARFSLAWRSASIRCLTTAIITSKGSTAAAVAGPTLDQ